MVNGALTAGFIAVSCTPILGPVDMGSLSSLLGSVYRRTPACESPHEPSGCGPPLTQDDINTFVSLFGEVDGDGVVNAADKALLLQAETDPNSPDAAYFETTASP